MDADTGQASAWKSQAVRRGLTVVAGWYLLASVSCVGVPTWILGPEFLGLGSDRASYGPARPCTEKTLMCTDMVGGMWDLILQIGVPVLVGSLVISVVMTFLLAPRFRSALYVGFLSAFAPWLAILLLLLTFAYVA